MATEAFKTAPEDGQCRPGLHGQRAFTANVAENYRKLGEAIDALGFKARNSR